MTMTYTYPEATFIELYKSITCTTICAHLPDVYKKIVEFSSITPNSGGGGGGGGGYKKHGTFDKKRQSFSVRGGGSGGGGYKANGNDSGNSANHHAQARGNQNYRSSRESGAFAASCPSSAPRGGIVFTSRRPKITSGNVDEYSLKVKEVGILMNKITQTTYTKLYVKIYDILKNDLRIANECLTKLFTLVSLNISLLDLYTQMFLELNKTFETECTEAVDGYVHYYINTIQYISNINPNDDYDDYCSQCKKNDTRRHLSKFFGCLRMNGAMESSVIVNLINRMHEMLVDFISQPDHKPHVNEIADNIEILVTSACTREDISKLSVSSLSSIAALKYNATDQKYPSLTSKSIFKCRDVVQKMKLIRDLKT